MCFYILHIEKGSLSSPAHILLIIICYRPPRQNRSNFFCYDDAADDAGHFYSTWKELSLL